MTITFFNEDLTKLYDRIVFEIIYMINLKWENIFFYVSLIV